jgi:hypothetical protein
MPAPKHAVKKQKKPKPVGKHAAPTPEELLAEEVLAEKAAVQEAMAEVAPGVVIEITAEVEAEVEPELEPEPEPEVEPEIVAEAEAAPEPEPEPEPEVEPEIVDEAEAEAAPEPEPEPESVAEAESASASEPEPAPESASETAPEPAPEPEFDPYELINPYDKQARQRRKLANRRASGTRRAILGVLAALVAVVVLGVGGVFAYNALRPADFSAYANSGISISGLEEEDFLITPAELAKLDIVELSATGSGKGEHGESKAGTVQAYGPSLETLVEAHGHSLDEYRIIRVYCKDGVASSLKPEELGDAVVILSVAKGKEPLDPYMWPMRLVIPEGESGSWNYGVMRIEFVSAEEAEAEADSDFVAEGSEIVTEDSAGGQ